MCWIFVKITEKALILQKKKEQKQEQIRDNLLIFRGVIKIFSGFQTFKNKAKDKRFFHIWCPLAHTCRCRWTYPPSRGWFRREDVANIRIKYYIQKF